MRRNDARARVDRASAELDRAGQRIAADWRSWREGLDRHRLSLLIGGGLLSGLAVAGGSPKHWSRAGAALFAAGARLTRSAIAPPLLGAFLAHLLGAGTASRHGPDGAAPAGPDA